MKKLRIIILGLISLMAVSAGCQNAEPNQLKDTGQNQKFGPMNQRFKNELNMNESQEKQWDKIHLEYRDKFMALRKDAASARNEKIAKGKAIADEMDKEMLAILDDNQKETYKKIVAENRAKAKSKYAKRKNGKSGQQPFIQMKNDLNLSESQTQQWDAIQEAYKPKFKEIRSSGQPGSDETKKEMVAMFEKKNAEIMEILDSDQQAKYSEFVAERKQMAKQRQNKN